MNVLVTGATGFLGSRIAEDLASDTAVAKVVAAGRTVVDTHQITHPKVTYELGDLSDKGYVTRLFRNRFDVVVNCASLSSPWGSYAQFHRANVQSQNHHPPQNTN